MTAEEVYLEQLWPLTSSSPQCHISSEKLPPWTGNDSTTFRAAYWHLGEDYAVAISWTTDGILSQCREDVANGTPSILLLENIPVELMGILGVAFNVDPQCWHSYLSNPPGLSAWDALFRTPSRFNVESIARKAGWSPENPRLGVGHNARYPTVMDFSGQLGRMTAFAQPCESRAYSRYPRLEHGDSGHGASMSTNVTYFLLADTICK